MNSSISAPVFMGIMTLSHTALMARQAERAKTRISIAGNWIRGAEGKDEHRGKRRLRHRMLMVS